MTPEQKEMLVGHLHRHISAAQEDLDQDTRRADELDARLRDVRRRMAKHHERIACYQAALAGLCDVAEEIGNPEGA